MRFCIKIISITAFFALFGCHDLGQYGIYQREFLGQVAVGSSVTKQIVLQNTSLDTVQHITGLNFEAGANQGGHFRIDKVEVGGVAQNPKDKDITVPIGSIVQVYVTYQPLNMNTSVASFGGWETGTPERYVPHAPADAMTALVSGETEKELATHRAMFTVVYDRPENGLVQIEVFGKAEEGPNGERSAGGGSSGDCPADGGILCYRGGFAIELPGIMNQGAVPLSLTAPVVFRAAGNNVSLDMGTFPSALLVLKGNGPGEPLEGKPISAVSIVISGAEGVTAKGTFDGANIELNGVSFRIRVVLGEIKMEDINPGLQAAVDFNVEDVSITTAKPYTNGSITLKAEAKLSAQPSGNSMFDQFLGNADVLVTMDGTLAVQ